MYLEVKQWPESQEVMDYPDWFFIQAGGGLDDSEDALGSSAYAKVIDVDSLIQKAVTKALDEEREAILKNIRGT